jgi:hypothetical protein
MYLQKNPLAYVKRPPGKFQLPATARREQLPHGVDNITPNDKRKQLGKHSCIR